MKLNVPNFRKLIKKTTMNFTIECLQLNFDPKEIKTAMISGPRDVLLNVTVENDCLTAMGEEDRITLNFSDPAGKLSRFLEIVPEEAEVKIEEGVKIQLSGKNEAGEPSTTNIMMVDDSIIRNYVSQKTAKEMKYFTTLPVDNSFRQIFDRHKKVGPYFQKVYFGIENKKLFIESGDRGNTRESGQIDWFSKEIDSENLVMCFEFRNFLNMVTVLEESNKAFTLNFTYSKDNDRGLVCASSQDEKEKFFLISRSL